MREQLSTLSRYNDYFGYFSAQSYVYTESLYITIPCCSSLGIIIGHIAVTVYFCNMIFSSRGNARLAYSELCNFCVSSSSMILKAFVQVITSASMICNLSHLKDRPRCTPSGTVS